MATRRRCRVHQTLTRAYLLQYFCVCLGGGGGMHACVCARVIIARNYRRRLNTEDVLFVFVQAHDYVGEVVQLGCVLQARLRGLGHQAHTALVRCPACNHTKCTSAVARRGARHSLHGHGTFQETSQRPEARNAHPKGERAQAHKQQSAACLVQLRHLCFPRTPLLHTSGSLR